jgi:hypothetical protein
MAKKLRLCQSMPRARSQSLDSCGIFKDAVLSILAVVAKQERVRRSERTRASIERRRSEGKRVGPEARIDPCEGARTTSGRSVLPGHRARGRNLSECSAQDLRVSSENEAEKIGMSRTNEVGMSVLSRKYCCGKEMRVENGRLEGGNEKMRSDRLFYAAGCMFDEVKTTCSEIVLSITKHLDEDQLDPMETKLALDKWVPVPSYR